MMIRYDTIPVNEIDQLEYGRIGPALGLLTWT